MLWSEVSAQCTDPLIYKLNDIQQLIANLTAKQEKQEANLTYCTAQIEKQEKEIANLTETIKQLEAENKDLRNNISTVATDLNDYKTQVQHQGTFTVC